MKKDAMDAAQSVKNLAKVFQSVIDIAEVIESLGSIEQAKRDAEMAKDAAYAEVEKAKVILASIKEEILSESEGLSDLEIKGEEIISSAKAKAEILVNEAKDSAKAVLSVSQVEKSRLKDELASLKDEKSIVLSSLSDAKVELKEVMDRIELVKEQARKALL